MQPSGPVQVCNGRPLPTTEFTKHNPCIVSLLPKFYFELVKFKREKPEVSYTKCVALCTELALEEAIDLA